MILKSAATVALLATIMMPVSVHAQARILGDSAACVAHEPAIRVDISGLKDRSGELKLELYPANEADFLKHGADLVKAGKTFRRVRAPTPASGPISVCVKVPAPGRYALVFTHNRDGKNKFGFFADGAGLASNQRLGRSRPKVGQATVDVGNGVTEVTIRAQYFRGLGGFGPIKD